VIYHSPNLVYSWVKWEYQSSYWDHLINFACSNFFSHSPSWTTMHLYQISIIASSVSCILYLEFLCSPALFVHAWSTMDGPTWKGKLLLATQIVSYLMIKEQGGTSVALWTTNHTRAAARLLNRGKLLLTTTTFDMFIFRKYIYIQRLQFNVSRKNN